MPVVGCILALPAGLAFYMMPADNPWHLAGLTIPRSIGLYVLFGMTTVWWMAPVYAALSDIIPAYRRATANAIFNLGLVMIGGGLGPLLIGVLSDLLTPRFGNEALRWALAASMVVYIIGIGAFIAAIRPYVQSLAKQPR